MSKVLTTFSGKFGDIIWSLATVKHLSEHYGEPVDFACMPAYRKMLPLLDIQKYINDAKVIDNWQCSGSPFGDQPWEPPKQCEAGYEHVHHLTYRNHPGVNDPLIDFTARQQHVKLRTPVVPFIEALPIDIFPPPPQPVIPIGFNQEYFTDVQQFIGRLVMRTSGLLAFVDVNTVTWVEAASIIAQAGIFVGCRSALWALAISVGAATITYEPNPSRHAEGQWGTTFGCHYGKETKLALRQTPHQAADQCAEQLLAWRDAYWSRERKGEHAHIH